MYTFVVGLLMSFILASSALSAPPERVALVIGNTDYGPLSKLNNPVRDANAIAAVLAQNGYDVSLHTNLAHAEFAKAIDAFALASRGAKEAVIYYSGHGMGVQREGQFFNALAPVDAQVDCQTRKASGVIAMEELLSKIAHVPQKLAIFDACRSEPCAGNAAQGLGFGALRFSSDTSSAGEQATRSAGVSTGSARGFIPVGDKEQSSILVAFATDLGAVALDGPDGGNSPFAEALLEQLRLNPRTPYRELLDATATRVAARTARIQVPWIVTKGGEPKTCLAGAACEIRETIVRERQLAESRKLAEMASDALRRGDVDAAIGLALEGLPEPTATQQSDQPRAFAIESHAVLERALRRGSDQLTLSGHEAPTMFLSFSKDGTRLVTSGFDPFAMIWNVATGRPVARLGGAPDPYLQHRLSPNGHLVATLGARTLSAYSHDGKEVVIWDARDGKKIHDLPVADFDQGSMPGFGRGAETFDFLDDEHILLNDDRGIAIWRIRDRTKIAVIPSKLTGYVRAFAGPQSRTIGLLQAFEGGGATAGSSRIEIWDRKTLRQVASISPHQAVAYGAVSLDGSYLVTGSPDRRVKGWDLATGRLLFTIDAGSPVTAVAISKDRGLVAAATQNGAGRGGDLFVWSISTQVVKARSASVFQRGPRELKFDERSMVLAADAEAGVLYDVARQLVVRRLKLPARRTGDDQLVNAIFSPDGEWLAVAGSQGTVALHRTAAQQAQKLTEDEVVQRLQALSFMPSELNWQNASALVGSLQGELKTAMTGASGNASSKGFLARLPESGMVATASLGRLQIWNLDTGALLVEEATGLDAVTGVAVDRMSNALVVWMQQHRSVSAIKPTKGDSVASVNLLSNVADAVRRGRTRIARCLTPQARVSAGLSPVVPEWCAQTVDASAARRSTVPVSSTWEVGAKQTARQADFAPVERRADARAIARRSTTIIPSRANSDERARIGVKIRSIDASFLRSFGHSVTSAVLITEATAAMPATAAGLKPGDIIVGLENERVENAESFSDKVSRASKSVTIEFVRIGDDAAAVRAILSDQGERSDGAAAFFIHLVSKLERGLSSDDETYWLRKAAQHGHVEAMVGLARTFAAADKNSGDAAAWFLKAAEAGNPDAIKAVAMMYATGRGLNADPGEAARWMLLAAQSGDADSMYNWALMLDQGDGAGKDPEHAAEWAMKAVLHGSEHALKQTAATSTSWSRQFRRALHSRLKGAGLYSGPINDRFTDKTRIALKKLASQGMRKR